MDSVAAVDAFIDYYTTDKKITSDEFLERWNRLPYTAFCRSDLRRKLWKIVDDLMENNEWIFAESRFTDPFLPAERLVRIVRDLSIGSNSTFFQIGADLKKLKGCSFGTGFCHRMIYLFVYLIQFKYYSHTALLLKQAPWLGLYEDFMEDGRECIYTYAVRMVSNEQKLFDILDTFKDLAPKDVRFYNASPLEVAVAAKRDRVAQHLREIGLW